MIYHVFDLLFSVFIINNLIAYVLIILFIYLIDYFMILMIILNFLISYFIFVNDLLFRIFYLILFSFFTICVVRGDFGLWRRMRIGFFSLGTLWCLCGPICLGLRSIRR